MSRPLRILYHHRIRADDGQAVHVRELIAALRGRGHEVVECALVPKSPAPKGTVTAGGGSPPGAAFWQRLRLPRTAVEVMEVLYNRRGRAMLRAAAGTLRPDLLYERHALHCRAGLDMARELGVPLFLEVNSPMCDEMEKLGLLCFPGRARATERQVLAGADRVLPVTAVLGRMLVQRGARAATVRVVPNGAVPERYGAAEAAAGRALRARLGVPEAASLLGFVGYLRPWHRLDLVLDLMGRPAFSDLHLALMGRGPALPPLLDRAAREGLGGRLHAPGTVPADLLPAHLLACDAAIVPAINAYASPLKLFDSLAAGVPTLAPDQENLREIIRDGENGVLFEPGSLDSLARAMGSLMGDRELARRIGRQGRQSLLDNRWTWDGNAARIESMFAEGFAPAAVETRR